MQSTDSPWWSWFSISHLECRPTVNSYSSLDDTAVTTANDSDSTCIEFRVNYIAPGYVFMQHERECCEGAKLRLHQTHCSENQEGCASQSSVLEHILPITCSQRGSCKHQSLCLSWLLTKHLAKIPGSKEWIVPHLQSHRRSSKRESTWIVVALPTTSGFRQLPTAVTCPKCFHHSWKFNYEDVGKRPTTPLSGDQLYTAQLYQQTGEKLTGPRLPAVLFPAGNDIHSKAFFLVCTDLS